MLLSGRLLANNVAVETKTDIMNREKTESELRSSIRDLRSELEAMRDLRRQSSGASSFLGSIILGAIGGALLMWLIASFGVSKEKLVILPVLGVVAAFAKGFQVNRRLDRRIHELGKTVPELESQLDSL